MDAMAGSEGSSSLDNGTAAAASPQAQAVKLHFVQQEIEYRIRQAVDAVVGRLEKEAAAAERKVAFMEQELMNVKEHALSMLLNLKHASDAQILHLERQLLDETKRAEEAEARVASLEDTLKRTRADSRKKVQRRAQEEEEVEEADCRVADSLFLIAGVACDNALSSECQHDQPKREHASSSSVEAEADESPSPGLRTESDEQESSRKNRKSRTSRQARSSERLCKLASGCKRARGRSSKRLAVDTSSRDSRRLMQGARQLFSLAEKNWR